MGLQDVWDWITGVGTDSGGTGSGRRVRISGDDRQERTYRKCPLCGKDHRADKTWCDEFGKKIEWPLTEPTQVSIADWAINTAIAIALVGGIIYLGPPAAATKTAVAIGIGLVASNSAEAGAGTTQPPGPNAPGIGTNTGGAYPARPGEVTKWMRTGPFYASGDQEGRMPKYMEVNGTTITYTTEKDGKTWTNTLNWETVPPETLEPGQEVHLKMTATTQQGWGNVGGWWNCNCRVEMKGEASAGSDVNYRREGGPHNVGDITFKFNPSDGNPYIQLSAGHDPAPDTWILITYKYVPAP